MNTQIEKESFDILNAKLNAAKEIFLEDNFFRGGLFITETERLDLKNGSCVTSDLYSAVKARAEVFLREAILLINPKMY